MLPSNLQSFCMPCLFFCGSLGFWWMRLWEMFLLFPSKRNSYYIAKLNSSPTQSKSRLRSWPPPLPVIFSCCSWEGSWIKLEMSSLLLLKWESDSYYVHNWRMQLSANCSFSPKSWNIYSLWFGVRMMGRKPFPSTGLQSRFRRTMIDLVKI